MTSWRGSLKSDNSVECGGKGVFFLQGMPHICIHQCKLPCVENEDSQTGDRNRTKMLIFHAYVIYIKYTSSLRLVVC